MRQPGIKCRKIIQIQINFTHLNLAPHKRDIGKQCRSGSDTKDEESGQDLHCFCKIQSFWVKNHNDKINQTLL